MYLVHSDSASAKDRSEKIGRLLDTISESQLRAWVEGISVPRHFGAEAEQNRRTAKWLTEIFQSFDYRVERQGPYCNLIAIPNRTDAGLENVILVGAHYDTVPMTPGADDNGSAVAAMLGCAAACSLWRPMLPLMFVAFNREEDSLAGSRNFIETFVPTAPFKIHCAHVLEMVGYASSSPGSQRVPPGLPIRMRDVGDFLGLLANGNSTPFMNAAISLAKPYTPALPVTGLSVRLGMEKFFPVLVRSDHAPFWAANIPAVMWTDTSEFRNPNYHRDTDTPDTLNYSFLLNVTRLVTATVIESSQKQPS